MRPLIFRTPVAFLTFAVTVAGAENDGTWTHPRCTRLPLTKFGPFIELSNGKLMTFDGIATWLSSDGDLWVTTRYHTKVAVSLREDAFVGR